MIQKYLRAYPSLWAMTSGIVSLHAASCCTPPRQSVSLAPPPSTPENDDSKHMPGPRVSGAVLVRPSEAAADTRQAWVTLREPLPQSAAIATIRRLCAALSAESSDDLAELLTPDAWIEVQGERRPALTTWTSRFARLPYQLVPCEEALDLSKISLIRSEQPELLGEGRALGEGSELVARVPVLRGQLNGERLFGASLFVGLRRAGDEYRITSMRDP